ncbi:MULTISPECIES: hypothetical protein [unclassified Sulfitobacter]|uniref:hypothetical protein n=1 Tax=unclassified Sulfitobacter TaxID=196795 RepID=UPI003744ED27
MNFMRIFVVVCVVVVCSLIGSSLWVGWYTTLTTERGAAEQAGLIVFAIGALMSALRMPAGAWRLWWPIPAVFVLFCLRELDVHNAFFEPGLLQTRVFISPLPIWQKIVSALAMGAVVLTLVTLLVRGLRPMAKALRAGQGWAWGVVFGLFCAIASVLIDGADRQLAAIGVTLPYADSLIWVALEEMLELCFALSLIFAICMWGRQQEHATLAQRHRASGKTTSSDPR